MRRPRGLRLALFLGCVALVAPVGRPGTAAADPPVDGRAARAEAALERVEALTGDRTLALRDLALLRDDLPAALQERAASYLSRPTANAQRCPDFSCYTTGRVRRVCTGAVCVHFVRRADDARNGVPDADRDGDGRPDYVERVLASVAHVHRTYVAAGYRRPIPDGSRGGDGRTDVYLAQIGDQRLYGYCTTDESDLPRHGAAWAYCVLDNDYRRQEFPRHTPLENMRVTAAHEYFHAVQFGYDIGEDAWFMEATATWVEDEVYDGVDDNVAYLRSGPIGHPAWSLDSTRGAYYYGAWIFFRHVTEHFPASVARLPVVVRSMWRYADAAGAASDLYSMAAVEQALRDEDSSTAAEYLRMSADNLHPRRWYDEGSLYPAAPLEDIRTLTTAQPRQEIALVQDHLTAASYRLEPGPDLLDAQLRITLDLGPTSEGSDAIVRVLLESGGSLTVEPELSPEGDWEGSVAFSAAVVKAVEVTVVNASVRYRCNVASGWSCQGRPLDQDVPQSISVLAEQPSG